MEKITINQKVKEVIINNRTPYSNFAGKMFGQDLFKPQTRVMDPDYQDKIDVAKSNGNSDIVLNRSPRRFGIYSITVASIEVGTNVADEPVLIINKGTKDEIQVPSNCTTEFGKADVDAVKDAIKNPDKNQVFSDVEFLGKLSNQLNEAEIARIENMIKFLEKAKSQCESAIGETNNKIKTYKDQKAKSASKLQGNVSTEVNVNIQ